jgi:predicted DNA-binding transcriptional regulator AlpA
VASPPDPLVNLAQAAKWLSLGQSTLRQKLYEGEGPTAIKLPGSDRWRFRPSDLAAYVEKSKVVPVAKSAAALAVTNDEPRKTAPAVTAEPNCA